MPKIYSKLMSIQTKIKAPKNLTNTFGKYKYRNAESILEAVKPYLQEQNASLLIQDDIETIDGRMFLKSTVILIDCEDGESINTHAYVEIDESHKGMSREQVLGSASSYCRKYCLNAMFLLDDTKDEDADEFRVHNENKAKDKEEKQKHISSQSKELTEEMLNELTAKMKEADVLEEKVFSMFNISSLSELTKENYEKCIHKLDLTIEAKEKENK